MLIMVLSGFVAVLVVVSVISLLIGMPSRISLGVAIGVVVAGLLLAATGMIIRQSPVQISGSIGRKEFYGVVAALFGWSQIWLINLTSRIDSIFQMLAK